MVKFYKFIYRNFPYRLTARSVQTMVRSVLDGIVSEDKAIHLLQKDDNELRRQREMAKSNWECKKKISKTTTPYTKPLDFLESNVIPSIYALYSKIRKDKVDKGLLALHLSELTNAGALNYAIHQVISQYISQNKESYQTYNDIVGVLDCAKMELYRRLISDYEDKKMTQNKDVPPYDK